MRSTSARPTGSSLRCLRSGTPDARSALRRVLARRGLPLSAEEEARVEACASVVTLERWLDEAVVAPSAAEALAH